MKMSFVGKALDTAKGQILNSELGKQVTQVWETLGITSLTGKNLSKEETQIQLDLFKKNFAESAKLTHVDWDFDKITKEALDNTDWLLSELTFQWFEKWTFESKVKEYIKALQEAKIAKKIGSNIDLWALESSLLALAPWVQSIWLSKIPLMGWLFGKLNGGKLEEVNKILSEINGDLAWWVTAESKEWVTEDENFDEWEIRTVGSGEILASSIQVSTEAKALIDYAETYDGMKYMLGWNWKSRIDCSKLVDLVIEKWWISNFNPPARNQINDKRLLDRDPSDVKQWDLVFFKNTWKEPVWKVSHVGFVSAVLSDGSYVILDASTNEWKVATRVIKPTSPRYGYIFKDTSGLVKDLKIENMAYNEHTWASVDGEIQTA